MQAKKLQNYLRTYRKKSGLSQKDLALLVGRESASVVSRYEAGSRTISLETAVAFSVVYGVPLGDLFAGMVSKVEEETIARLLRFRDQEARALLSSLIQHP